MLNFKTLTYTNFLSVGDSSITIDFEDTKSTLIVGHNGSGKSLMLDALSFALFGKAHRGINKAQLINSINGKKLMTVIEFTVGLREYKIVRGLKPNIFEIWVDGEMINQASHARDYQKLLETNILKLNHKSFHQVVVLGSSSFIPFMQLRTYERRGVIEDLLDISVFSKMNQVLKESYAKLKDQIKDTTYNRNLIIEKLKMQRTHISKLESISESNKEKILKEISDLEIERDNLITSNDELNSDYADKNTKAVKELQSINRRLTKLRQFESRIQTKIDSEVTKSEFYVKHSDCPTCSQSISADVRESKIIECRDKQAELKSGKDELLLQLTGTTNLLSEQQDEMKDLQLLSNKMSSNQTLISRFNKRIITLQNDSTKEGGNNDLVTAKKDLGVMVDDKAERDDLLSTQVAERHYKEVISELLKDTGIKTKIIRQYLPVMNKLINNYLHTLDFFVSFELDENFNETIRSRHRDDFSYASFSEGEKQRIDLSLLFAWRQIAKMKNSANTNLMILDEVFDASLDIDGIDNLLKIMNTLSEDTRVFVISHKQDLLEGRFERKIEFERRNNFTKIKSIT